MKQLFILICIFSCYFSFTQNEKKHIKLDSIFTYRAYSKNTSLTFEERILYAKKAIELSNSYGKDSTKIKSQKGLSTIYINQLNTKGLKSVNFIVLEIASKIKDSAALANANFVLGYAYDVESKKDSAYFYYSKAVKYFEILGDTKDYIYVVSNMSDIQQSERDYIGAEINSVRALKTLESLPNTEANMLSKWDRYNLLGIVSGELENFDKALEYYNLSLDVVKDLPNAYYYNLYSRNNIGSIYRRKGDYPNAIKIFSNLLKDEKLLISDPESYSNIKANLAYSKFLNNNFVSEEVSRMFMESFKLSSDLKDEFGVMATSAYYAEFLKKENKIDSAKKYANLAYEIATKTKTNSFVFKTLITKAELEKDSSNIFLKEYIKLNDSLITAERSIRNKFARIDYETDVIIQEKEAISKQNLWLLILSIVLLLSIVSVYVIKTQREKNKELQLAQQQQEANEEIYNLMLSQQDKMDEARAVEKNRISQEIHDGILGRLFGTRLSLDSLNMVNTEEAIISRENYIKDLMEIEKDIRKVSHDLNTDFITHASFSNMITTLVETQCSAYGLKYNTKIDSEIKWDNLTNKKKIHIYRIVQESLQNIYKHANADLVEVALQQKENFIYLTIVDNGVGYDKSKQKEGIGLKNIKSRVVEIEGKQEIFTKINEGTTVNIEIPI